jgi:hypothetical protein
MGDIRALIWKLICDGAGAYPGHALTMADRKNILLLTS